MTNKQSNTNQAPSATKELYTKQPTRNKDFPMKKKQNECLRTDDENHLHVQKPIKHDQTHDRLKDDINAQTSTMANDTVDDHVPVRDPDANESGVADTTSIVPATQELLVQQTIGIITPHPHDVLSGRGAGVNHHPGNAHYRNLVKNYKMEYFRSPAPAKKQIIQVIVDKIVGKNPPGRFIRTDPKTELWECIPIEQAKKKTGQALREDAAKLKKMKLIQQYYGGNADIQTNAYHLNDVERLMDQMYTQDMVASPSPQSSSPTSRLPPRITGMHSYPANVFQRSNPIQYSYRPSHQSTIAQNTSPREAAMMLQQMHDRSPPSYDMSSSSVPATSMSPLRSNNVYSYEYTRHPHSIGSTASSPSRHTFAPASQVSQRTLTSPNAASLPPVHYQRQGPAMMAPNQEEPPPYDPSVERLYGAGGFNTTGYPYSSPSHERSTSRPPVYEHTHGTGDGPVSAANDNEPIDYNYDCDQNQYHQEHQNHLQQHQPHQQHQRNREQCRPSFQEPDNEVFAARVFEDLEPYRFGEDDYIKANAGSQNGHCNGNNAETITRTQYPPQFQSQSQSNDDTTPGKHRLENSEECGDNEKKLKY